jgi:hypothetical protein
MIATVAISMLSSAIVVGPIVALLATGKEPENKHNQVQLVGKTAFDIDDLAGEMGLIVTWCKLLRVAETQRQEPRLDMQDQMRIFEAIFGVMGGGMMAGYIFNNLPVSLRPIFVALTSTHYPSVLFSACHFQTYDLGHDSLIWGHIGVAQLSPHDWRAGSALMLKSLGSVVGLLKLQKVRDPKVRLAAGVVMWLCSEGEAGLNVAIGMKYPD